MKLVLAFARPVLLVFVILLVAVPVLAEDNLLGLFYDNSGSIDEIEISPNSTHSLYFVLLNPVNDEYDGGGSRPVDFISGFECAIEQPSGDILLDLILPGQGLNLGSIDNIYVGYASAVPVSSQGAAMLATLTVLTMGNNPDGYHLVPASPASHANTMAYIDSEDPDDHIVDMSPVSGSFDRPVFTFGDYTSEQDAAWGNVKALYR